MLTFLVRNTHQVFSKS